MSAKIKTISQELQKTSDLVFWDIHRISQSAPHIPIQPESFFFLLCVFLCVTFPLNWPNIPIYKEVSVNNTTNRKLLKTNYIKRLMSAQVGLTKMRVWADRYLKWAPPRFKKKKNMVQTETNWGLLQHIIILIERHAILSFCEQQPSFFFDSFKSMCGFLNSIEKCYLFGSW